MLDSDLELLNLRIQLLLLPLFFFEVLAQLVFLGVQFTDPDLELDYAALKSVVFLVFFLNRFLLVTNRPITFFVLPARPK